MTNLGKQSILNLILLVLSVTIGYAQEATDIELVCPDHVIVSCQSELQSIESYGSAMIRIGEERREMENQNAENHFDDCDNGYIERKWSYIGETDEKEYSCSQKIFVGQDEQRKPLIKWPTKELVVSWCEPSYAPNDLPVGAKRPEYFDGECNKMEHTYSDEIVYLSSSCKEVKREWVVHDWCYDSKNVDGNDGHYKFIQTIKFAVPEEVSYSELDDIYVTAEDCEKVRVDIDDMKADIESCNRRLRIRNDSPFADSNKKNASGIYPVGETVVTYKVELECTDTREFQQRIIVSNPCLEKAIIEKKELEVKLKKSFVRPNPFSQTTEIFFHNLSEATAQVLISDTDGNEIVNREISLSKIGLQSLKLSSADFKKPGVYLYRISIGDRTLEGKLIKIR